MGRLALLGWLALLAPGCARVQPWHKEALARPEMRFSQDGPTQHFFGHALVSVEQAEGGAGASGGGCGCR